MAQTSHTVAEAIRCLDFAEIEAVNGALLTGIKLEHIGMTIAVSDNCVHVYFDDSNGRTTKSTLTCTS